MFSKAPIARVWIALQIYYFALPPPSAAGKTERVSMASRRQFILAILWKSGAEFTRYTVHKKPLKLTLHLAAKRNTGLRLLFLKIAEFSLFSKGKFRAVARVALALFAAASFNRPTFDTITAVAEVSGGIPGISGMRKCTKNKRIATASASWKFRNNPLIGSQRARYRCPTVVFFATEVIPRRGNGEPAVSEAGEQAVQLTDQSVFWAKREGSSG